MLWELLWDVLQPGSEVVDEVFGVGIALIDRQMRQSFVELVDVRRDEPLDLEQCQTLLYLRYFVVFFVMLVLEGFFCEFVLLLQLQVELDAVLVFHRLIQALFRLDEGVHVAEVVSLSELHEPVSDFLILPETRCFGLNVEQLQLQIAFVSGEKGGVEMGVLEDIVDGPDAVADLERAHLAVLMEEQGQCFVGYLLLSPFFGEFMLEMHILVVVLLFMKGLI